MGMDIYGNNPSHERGAYFRANVWTWHPIADFIEEHCPDIAINCKHWHSNDGDGLSASDALLLGDELEQLIDRGVVDRHAAAHAAALAALPDETCRWCGGTGVRTDEIAQFAGQPSRLITSENGFKPDHPRFGQTGWCNGCDGTGKHRPFTTSYRFVPEMVAEFAQFCHFSGGFRIC